MISGIMSYTHYIPNAVLILILVVLVTTRSNLSFADNLQCCNTWDNVSHCYHDDGSEFFFDKVNEYRIAVYVAVALFAVAPFKVYREGISFIFHGFATILAVAFTVWAQFIFAIARQSRCRSVIKLMYQHAKPEFYMINIGAWAVIGFIGAAFGLMVVCAIIDAFSTWMHLCIYGMPFKEERLAPPKYSEQEKLLDELI
jgi:hypothetical protein